jgi:hypothetical protein
MFVLTATWFAGEQTRVMAVINTVSAEEALAKIGVKAEDADYNQPTKAYSIEALGPGVAEKLLTHDDLENIQGSSTAYFELTEVPIL